MDIQTDGDYTKRVVTPFGTTRLKINRHFQFHYTVREPRLNAITTPMTQ